MTAPAIITQVVLLITNLTLIGVGTYMAVKGKYPFGARIATWLALAGFILIQAVFLWSDLR